MDSLVLGIGIGLLCATSIASIIHAALRYRRGTLTLRLIEMYIAVEIMLVALLFFLIEAPTMGIIWLSMLPIVCLIVWATFKVQASITKKKVLLTSEEVRDPDVVRNYLIERLIDRSAQWYTSQRKRQRLLKKALAIAPADPRLIDLNAEE